jgi:hypothetical protein
LSRIFILFGPFAILCKKTAGGGQHGKNMASLFGEVIALEVLEKNLIWENVFISNIWAIFIKARQGRFQDKKFAGKKFRCNIPNGFFLAFTMKGEEEKCKCPIIFMNN